MSSREVHTSNSRMYGLSDSKVTNSVDNVNFPEEAVSTSIALDDFLPCKVEEVDDNDSDPPIVSAFRARVSFDLT